MQVHACAVRNVLRQLPDSGIQFRRGERPGKTLSCHGFQSFMLGACLSISREPRPREILRQAPMGYPRRLETKRLMDTHIILLPGQRLSASGRPRLDHAAVARLAFPLMLNSATQAVLNATDN